VSDRWLTYLKSIGGPFSGRLLMVDRRSNHTWPFCVWGLVKSIHKHCVRPFIPVLLIEYSRYWEKIREVSLGPCADGQAKSVSEMHALVRATTSGLVNSQRRGSCFSKACLKSSRSLSLNIRDSPVIEIPIVAHNLARWLLRNEQDAQDVVPEAYLRAL